MQHIREELAEAKRQIGSLLHKLRETHASLSAKETADRLKSQITVGRARECDAITALANFGATERCLKKAVSFMGVIVPYLKHWQK